MAEHIPPDDLLVCQQVWCIGRPGGPDRATVAIDAYGFTGGMPRLACNECAVRKMSDADPWLGWKIISIADWRASMQPRTNEVLAQLAQAQGLPHPGSDAAPGASQAVSSAEDPALANGAAPQALPASARGSSAPEAPSSGGDSTETAEQAPAITSTPPEPPWRRRPVLRAVLISWVLAVVLLWTGVRLNLDTGSTTGVPLVIIAAVLFLWPVIAFVIWAVVDIGKDIAAEGRQYSQWKQTLTPEQRAAVTMAEAAVLTAAAHELRKHNKERSQRHVDQIMHGFGDRSYPKRLVDPQQPTPWQAASRGPQPRMWRQPGNDNPR